MNKKLLLLDVYNFLHRAYHAMPKTFKDKNGEPVNAVYGVTSMLINLLDNIKPQYMVAALDSPTDITFRNEDFSGYKAHRKPMEADFESQIPKVLEIIEAFGIKSILVNGYEADDVIATMATRFKKDADVIIVSNDHDLWQLAKDNVMLMVPNTKGETEWLGEKEVRARLGFDSSLIADYKGLRGDTSDNIPGVYGIGEKTATGLLQKYGSMEEIFKNAETVTPVSLREKLLNSYEVALMSKKLAQLIYDVPFSVTLAECKYSEFNKLAVKKLLEEYNFKSLIRRMGFEVSDKKKAAVQISDDQLGLF